MEINILIRSAKNRTGFAMRFLQDIGQKKSGRGILPWKPLKIGAGQRINPWPTCSVCIIVCNGALFSVFPHTQYASSYALPASSLWFRIPSMRLRMHCRLLLCGSAYSVCLSVCIAGFFSVVPHTQYAKKQNTQPLCITRFSPFGQVQIVL